MFTFRSVHSTTFLLTKFMYKHSENYNNDVQTTLVFLDIDKVFH